MLILNDFKCLLFVILTLIQWVICYDMTEDKIQVNEFDVMPGGAVNTFDKELNGFACKFSYACQGGTKEQWLMSITGNNDGTKFVCSVERPGGKSYLFFQSFHIEVFGARAMEAAAFGSNGASLKPEEFKIDLDKNLITDVPGKFGSQLEKITLYAERGRIEL